MRARRPGFHRWQRTLCSPMLRPNGGPGVCAAAGTNPQPAAGVLDEVEKRGDGYGRCGLIACTSDAKLEGQGREGRGAEAAAIMGRSLGNEKYLWGMDPSDICKAVVAHYGVRFRTYDWRNP